MELAVGATRPVVARFWEWYEAAPQDERLAYEWTSDFGRAHTVDVAAWTILPPSARVPNGPWRAYPSGLDSRPDQERMLRASSRDDLNALMAGLQIQATAWALATAQESDAEED